MGEGCEADASNLQNVIRTLDAANSRLEETMDILRSTMVEAAFRPDGEEPRSLLDFVDQQGVETMRDALKESIRETKVGIVYCQSHRQLLTIDLGSSNRVRFLDSFFRR